MRVLRAFGMACPLGRNMALLAVVLEPQSESVLARREIDPVTDDILPSEPTTPFIRITDHEMNGFDPNRIGRWDPGGKYAKSTYQREFKLMLKKEFDERKYLDNARIIDVNCWKFPIIDIIDLGYHFELWNLLGGPKRHKVRYVYDTPVKMTFEEAREEVVELICKKRWYRQAIGGERQERFRERFGLCENMHDLINGRQIASGSKAKYHWIGGISIFGGDNVIGSDFWKAHRSPR
jgi:hypothetical protein